MTHDLVLVARIPPGGREAFDRYEDAVLPLVPEHGGTLHGRWRGTGELDEVHHLRFAAPAGLAAFQADPRRADAQPLLAASGAETHLLTVGAVPRSGAAVDGVRLEPTATADAAALREIHASPEIVRWWDEPDPGFPTDDEPEATRFTIHVGDEVAGLIQYSEEDEPKYRHAAIDVFLAGRFHGRGVGSAAVREVLARLLEERGHHRVTIDPAAGNLAAIRCYARAGFLPVGLLRLAERDWGGAGWHDVLLMELVVEPSVAT